MRVLVIGSGGREHVLAWKVAKSPLVREVFAMPGSPGMEGVARPVDVDISDHEAVAHWALQGRVDLVVVGPEAPLVGGIADHLAGRGLRVFGPSTAAARLEGSKSFARDLARAMDIPGPWYRTFERPGDAIEFLDSVSDPVVVKADGLAAGKGVFVTGDVAEAREAIGLLMAERKLGQAGARVVIEERLEGEELSLLVLTDGERIVPLASSQDHKAAHDGDLGPNTGGMGAYSPAPVATDALIREALDRIVAPAVRGMSDAGCRYRGVMYAGLMVTDDGPKLLEFNVRFGDPEAQVVIPRMDGDLVPLLAETAAGELRSTPSWRPQAALGVVMASGGYPGSYDTGDTISGLDERGGVPGVMVFHAGTARSDGEWRTAGGRVVCVTAMGDTLAGARNAAYDAVSRISFRGAHYRRDIGHRAL